MTNIKKRILLCSFTCVILFAIDLIAGRIFIPEPKAVLDVADPIRVKNSYYHHGLRPNYSITEKMQQYTFDTFTNSLGCRDSRIRTVQKSSSDKEIILFMGDSFVEGVGVDFDKTFVGVLADSLKNKYEIINGGVVSYSPMIYYLRTKYLLEVEHLKIGRIICFIDTTDAYDEYLYQVVGKFKPRQKETISNIWDNNVMKLINRTSFLSWSLSTIYQYNKAIKLRWGTEFWTVDEAKFNSFGKQGLMLAEENMGKLIALCRQYNIPITLVVYPWPYMIQARDVNSIQSSFWKFFAEKNSVAFIDLFPVFINETPADEVINTYFLQNDSHWNEKGHKLVSQQILDSINNSMPNK